MIVIACVDEKGGMMFHRRRQSQDRALREDVLRECKGKKLYMSSYSYGMFEKEARKKQEAGEGGRCGNETVWVGEGLRESGETEIRVGEGLRESGETEIWVGEDFLGRVGKDEFCFVEGQDISGVQGQIHAVILYQWNRRYPADVYFGLDLAGEGWELEKREEFQGSSHERITKKVYRKR